ncbi:MAG: hypothetical protein LAQ30_07095 [Acidobacteriia bacterium]|nr:hypothetical protein [Terriglobia bacterium]
MLVVVGGHSRNIGKTSLAAGLIRHFSARRWTAVKITQYGHGVCAREGTPCGCEAEPEHPIALSEEYEPGGSDSGRFLAAGAARSFWLRAPAGQLPSAAGVLRKILEQNANVIVESNSILEVAQPTVFLMLLDFACGDFKDSSLRFLDRADAYVVIDRGLRTPVWKDLARGRWDGRPRFPVKPPNYATAALCGFVESRLSTDSRAR